MSCSWQRESRLISLRCRWDRWAVVQELNSSKIEAETWRWSRIARRWCQAGFQSEGVQTARCIEWSWWSVRQAWQNSRLEAMNIVKDVGSRRQVLRCWTRARPGWTRARNRQKEAELRSSSEWKRQVPPWRNRQGFTQKERSPFS